MQRIVQDLRRRKKTIGFVPTMGALHTGHLSLIKQACKENDIVIVSIFVNPAQFGSGEDFRRYPRNLKVDALLCRNEGVDFIFYPDAADVYPKGYKTYVIVEQLSDVLCGKFRPGHFKGVATIVTKLFNIVQPDIAYFGQKDAQQAVIIQQMVKDLNMSLKIKVLPIIREPDGLAMSSRNAYLSEQERKDAAVLHQALRKAQDLIKRGTTNPSKIILAMRRIIRRKESARIQYIEIVDPDELKPVKKIKDRVLIALAVYVGKTRLIDNLIINSNIKNTN